MSADAKRPPHTLGETEDFGAALRARREATGRSLRELADATKLSARTLDALERNQVEKLPPGIFYRAVVRAYAREVGLDPEATLRGFLERYPDELPPPGRPIGPVADAPRVGHGTTRWLSGAAAGLVAIAVVIAVALWWWRGQPSAPERPGPPRTAAAATLEEWS